MNATNKVLSVPDPRKCSKGARPRAILNMAANLTAWCFLCWSTFRLSRFVRHGERQFWFGTNNCSYRTGLCRLLHAFTALYTPALAIDGVTLINNKFVVWSELTVLKVCGFVGLLRLSAGCFRLMKDAYWEAYSGDTKFDPPLPTCQCWFTANLL